ncbi:hypothetical protein K443DRAFT_11068 [Laccaria amethystina LaAM-08-1]|uniref:HMG box domain-containing protein n=1 Tax=Laccaria amethystina LaAM-08-1 TaxID=1095629 RepID=A0A0C9WK62_9AGAR|nr:hypothetical protein K443DRAFT_11068 [Laccaria amethystina LaAM-08-1]
MPPIRDHEVDYENTEDDDMPPLVDNPAASMTYTFFTDMTPMSFTNPDPPQASTSAVQLHSRISPPASPNTLPAPHPNTRPHGKRRDASYIPRPPNAFILFRSSFIRSEQVPGKVEGNHSTLSKIIGMYWKSLSREERESWEAKAVVAQAEHRKKYPDWRFRPGANAMAKLKIKDGGTVIRRRSARSRTKDPPDDGDGGAGDEAEDSAKGRDKGKRKAQTKGKEESRCEKIANLLVEGKKGADLEKAVKQWEGMNGNQKETSQLPASSSSTRPRRSRKTTIPTIDSIPRVNTRIETAPMQDVSQPDSTSTQIQSDNPAPLPVGLSAVPLTHMFKRSLSLPSSNPRLTLPESTITLPSDAASPGDWEVNRIGTPSTPSLRHHPHSQTATTGDTATSFPLLCTPFTPQASYGPRQLPWEDEEARRRRELSQEGEYWWPSSGLEDQIADAGCERPDMIYNEQYGASLEPPNDGSELVTWSTNPDRQGLVAVIQDPHMHCEIDVPLSTPLPPPVSTDPSNYFYTSQCTPLPASSFSTLSGWAGDYKYEETSRQPTSSATNTTASAPMPAWYDAPGWEGHQHQFNHPSLYVSSDDWDRIEANHGEEHHIRRRS